VRSDAACLDVSAAMHSGRGHFLSAMTPATPPPPTWSGLPAPETAGTGPPRGSAGFGGGERRVGKTQEETVCLHMQDCVCVCVCVCERVCENSSCVEWGACRTFQRKNERKKERKSFSRESFSLKLRVQLERFYPPSSLVPSSFSPSFQPPSLPPFCFPVSPSSLLRVLFPSYFHNSKLFFPVIRMPCFSFSPRALWRRKKECGVLSTCFFPDAIRSLKVESVDGMGSPW